MPVRVLKSVGQDLVVLPKSEYLALKRLAGKQGGAKSKHVSRDEQDAVRALQLLADPKQVPIPWEKARKRLA